MAGELTIDTLHSTVQPFATGNAFSGIAKAWVNFNGTTGSAAIRGSFNVGSVTALGTGLWQINYTSPMPNANYAVLATACNQPIYANDGSGGACINNTSGTDTMTVNSVNVMTYLVMNSPGRTEASFITCVAVFA